MIYGILYYAFRSLIITIILELIISILLGVRDYKDMLLIILVNLLTNSIMNATLFTINYYCGILYKNIGLIIFELLIVFIEGYIYKKKLNYNKINSYVLSLLLNICSFGVGFLIN